MEVARDFSARDAEGDRAREGRVWCRGNAVRHALSGEGGHSQEHRAQYCSSASPPIWFSRMATPRHAIPLSLFCRWNFGIDIVSALGCLLAEPTDDAQTLDASKHSTESRQCCWGVSNIISPATSVSALLFLVGLSQHICSAIDHRFVFQCLIDAVSQPLMFQNHSAESRSCQRPKKVNSGSTWNNPFPRPGRLSWRRRWDVFVAFFKSTFPGLRGDRWLDVREEQRCQRREERGHGGAGGKDCRRKSRHLPRSVRLMRNKHCPQFHRTKSNPESLSYTLRSDVTHFGKYTKGLGRDFSEMLYCALCIYYAKSPF